MIFGGDISLYGLDKFSIPKFEELKMRPILDDLKLEGLIQSFAINSSPIYRQFMDMKMSRSEIYDFSIGDGLRCSKAKTSGWAGIFS